MGKFPVFSSSDLLENGGDHYMRSGKLVAGGEKPIPNGGRFMSGAVLTLLVAASGCFGGTNLLSPDNQRDIEPQPGVVRIVVRFKAALFGRFTCTATATGTGFLYRPDGYLITNGHVAQWARPSSDARAEVARMKIAVPCLVKEVLKAEQASVGRQLTEKENNSVLAQVAQAIEGGRIQVGEISLRVLLDNGAPGKNAEIKAYSDPIDEDGKDIAILKIDGTNLPTVELGSSDGVNVGDPVSVMGYPGAADISEESYLVPTVTHGRVSALKHDEYKGTPVLQSEAPIDHGNSGGPAFDASGRVIGVATYTFKEGAQLNFFVPVNTALEFVRQAGASPERGSFDQKWHEAFEAYVGQHWSRAYELMGRVVEMMPGQPDAKRLQLQAEQNIPSNPLLRWIDELGMPVVLGVVGVVLAIVLAIGVAAMKKGATKSAPSPLPAIVSVVPQPPPEPAPKRALSGRESFGSLQISNGPLAGNRFIIPKSGLMIGRDPSTCAVVLPSDAVSKQHVWVVPLDNGVAVIDRDSVNGTYVNSTESPRISKVVLKDGDRIFVGNKSPTEIMYFRS
jgi:serine protease Do